MMHGRGKSDSVVVAVKPANKAARSAAELVEPRAGAEGNASQQSAHRAQDRESVSQALERIRHASPSSTQGESRMHQRARTDRGGGREVTRVPTATDPERGPLGSVEYSTSWQCSYRVDRSDFGRVNVEARRAKTNQSSVSVRRELA